MLSTLRRGLLAAAFAGAGLCSSAAAQTTHVVQLFTVSFSPQQLIIQEGDTVLWQWVTGFHDVKSGPGGSFNGIFNSGNPVPSPASFQVTFDAAFLAANPVPNDTYDYYCTIHLPVMVGQIIVQKPVVQPGVTPYGSGVNPPNSLSLLSGQPALGQSFTLGVRNSAVGTAPAAFAYLGIATLPDPNFPNGTVLPGFGLSSPGAFGELLISLAPGNPILNLGPVAWGGGASPAAPFPLAVPQIPSLAGFKLYFQGALITPSQGFALGVTNGLEVTIGG